MNINGIGSSKIINLYNNFKRSSAKISEPNKGDTITISEAGKSLSVFSKDENINLSTSSVDAIQKEVSNGTYNRDSKLIAEKMLGIMKNKEV